MNSNPNFIKSLNAASEGGIKKSELNLYQQVDVAVEQPQKELFLRGPIPLAWLSRAANLPGKTINTALAICWLVGMSNNKPIKLNRGALKHFNISKDAVRDALRRLESDGLILLQRMPSKQPSIEIIQVKKTGQ